MKKLLVSFAICLPMFSGCYINGQAGSGEKIGTIVKVAQEGLFSKTWEAQLIRGGMNGGSGSFGVQPFDFTITDYEMLKACQGYMESNIEVRVSYNKPTMGACTSSEHFAFATAITPMVKP